MGAITDLIELLIGVVVLPRAILFGWILFAASFGLINVFLSLIAQILILAVLVYLFFNFRRLIAYGLIIAILGNILDFLINFIGFSLV
ncbi:MAG: hypothetical protein KKG75_00070 [Nanoarchaeota archaeon]|nr:hypothetical protein [Nanoarchaeota archaeon]